MGGCSPLGCPSQTTHGAFCHTCVGGCLIKASDKSRQHGHCDGQRELTISQDPAASHTVVLASYLSAIPKHWWKGAGLISFQLTFAFICVCSVKVVLACC